MVSKKYFKQLRKIVKEIFTNNINESEIVDIINKLGPKGRGLLIEINKKSPVWAYGTCNAWEEEDILLSKAGNLLRVVGWEKIPFQQNKFYYEKLN